MTSGQFHTFVGLAAMFLASFWDFADDVREGRKRRGVGAVAWAVLRAAFGLAAVVAFGMGLWEANHGR